MRPRVLVLSLGGTITMTPAAAGGIAPTLDAGDLVAAVPELAAVADIEARAPLRLASASLTLAHMIDVAREIAVAFAQGCDGAVVIQGTDTIEETAFALDLLAAGDRPVVVTGAMRGAAAPGADGPANLLAAVAVAAAPQARGLGALVVLNDEVHAARHVRKAHAALPSAFVSPLTGPLGIVAEGALRLFARVARAPVLAMAEGAPPPVALLKIALGDDGRLLGALAPLGYRGAVIEGVGAGHVAAPVAPLLGALAAAMPVVLCARTQASPGFTRTYGYPGGEIDLIARGALPGGHLDGPKARMLLSLALWSGADPDAAFAFYRG